MNNKDETQQVRTAVALLRITLGLIIVATWFENLGKGLYTAQGLTDLFTHPDWGIFTNGGGAFLGYEALVRATVLKVPGLFGTFQLVGELLLGLGLLFGGLTGLSGGGARHSFFSICFSLTGEVGNGCGHMCC